MTPLTLTLTTANGPTDGPLTLRLLRGYGARGCTVWTDELTTVHIVAPGGWAAMTTYLPLSDFDTRDADCFELMFTDAEEMFGATVKACMTPSALAACAPRPASVVTSFERNG